MLLHRAAMHKDPSARLRSDAKKNLQPNSSLLILDFQTALVCQESVEATEVARQQMTWKYLCKLLNVTVGCASCVAAGFLGTVPQRRAEVKFGGIQPSVSVQQI